MARAENGSTQSSIGPELCIRKQSSITEKHRSSPRGNQRGRHQFLLEGRGMIEGSISSVDPRADHRLCTPGPRSTIRAYGAQACARRVSPFLTVSEGTGPWWFRRLFKIDPDYFGRFGQLAFPAATSRTARRMASGSSCLETNPQAPAFLTRFTKATSS